MIKVENPCNKDCKDRCVGCTKGCYKYLEYVIFHKKNCKTESHNVMPLAQINKGFVPISIYDGNKKHIKTFECMTDCARYMRSRYITSKSVDALRVGIRKAIDEGSLYMGFMFKVCDNFKVN